jgi:hypothetical protein
VHPGEGGRVEFIRGVGKGSLFVVRKVLAIFRKEEVRSLHCRKGNGEGVVAPFCSLTIMLIINVSFPPNHIVTFGKEYWDSIEVRFSVAIYSLFPYPPRGVDSTL